MWEKQFYGSTIIGERGQVVIPAQARESLKLAKGEKLLVFGLRGDSILLTKLTSFQRMTKELDKKRKEIDKILKGS